MQELLLAVARGLVEDKEAVQVTVDPVRDDGTTVYHLKVAESDMGRVIGKQGRIAKAKKSSLRSTKTFKALCRLVKCFFILVRRIIPCKAIFPPARSYPPTACVAK